MLKLIGFDCDGVLFDSRGANIAFYNAILEKFGLPAMEAEAVDYVHSHTFRGSLEYLFQGYGDLEEVLEYCRSLDYQAFIPLMVEEPHLKYFLNFLRPRFHTALATKRTTTTHHVLEQHGLAGYFDLVVSALDVSRPKPHPEAFWKILTHFNLQPEEAVYIGDSKVDEEFAMNAGVTLIAFRNPGLEAAYYLDSFAEGPELIRTLGALLKII